MELVADGRALVRQPRAEGVDVQDGKEAQWDAVVVGPRRSRVQEGRAAPMAEAGGLDAGLHRAQAEGGLRQRRDLRADVLAQVLDAQLAHLRVRFLPQPS